MRRDLNYWLAFVVALAPELVPPTEVKILSHCAGFAASSVSFHTHAASTTGLLLPLNRGSISAREHHVALKP